MIYEIAGCFRRTEEPTEVGAPTTAGKNSRRVEYRHLSMASERRNNNV